MSLRVLRENIFEIGFSMILSLWLLMYKPASFKRRDCLLRVEQKTVYKKDTIHSEIVTCMQSSIVNNGVAITLIARLRYTKTNKVGDTRIWRANDSNAHDCSQTVCARQHCTYNMRKTDARYHAT